MHIKKIYQICNLSIGFSKYEFNYKLLDDITLLKVTLDVTLTQSSLSFSKI